MLPLGASGSFRPIAVIRNLRDEGRGGSPMLERLFLSAMRYGARILFAAALVMLGWGIAYAANALSNSSMDGPSLAHQAGWLGAILAILYGSFAPAAYLFFGALIIHHLEQQAIGRDAT